MNLRKSIMIAMAQRDMIQKDLAEQIGMSSGSLSQLMSQKSCTGATLQKFADFFGMRVSEFIKLGED